MFTNILVPLDGSHLAEAALPVANYLALKSHASVILLHVIEKNAPEAIHGEQHLSDPDAALFYLKKVASNFFPPDISVSQHVHTSEVDDLARSIVEHSSSEFTPDLIILCSHGSGGLRDFFVGSIAQQVINLGKVPVLLIHPQKPEESAPFQCRSILAPMDGLPEHESGLPVLSSLGKLTESVVHLLQVVPTVGQLKSKQAAAGMLLPSAMSVLLEMTEENAQNYLDGIAAQLDLGPSQITTDIQRGDPVKQIHQTAQKINADLIFLTTHGKAGQNAFWAGSVAAKLCNSTQKPLLLVPFQKKEDSGL